MVTRTLSVRYGEHRAILFLRGAKISRGAGRTEVLIIPKWWLLCTRVQKILSFFFISGAQCDLFPAALIVVTNFGSESLGKKKSLAPSFKILHSVYEYRKKSGIIRIVNSTNRLWAEAGTSHKRDDFLS